MAKLERTYIVPLRKEFMKVPAHKRAKRAVRALRAFLVRHMKSENVKLGNFVNMQIWARSMKNPPRFVKVTAIKDEDGSVTAELFGKHYLDVNAEIEKQKKTTEEKKEKKADDKKEEKKANEKKETESKTEAPKKAAQKKE
ncbi:MAG: 50S ribosomal protein L31e [Candidatus Woesearchaeota archaeon]|nr:50S ribosomal protein L31e [Candidatus Woesearchaeota archaeon]